ncbi:MAG: protein-L-isoaspartate(D-aspartate) O-methyltransferase [Ignavibacterium sp.]
MYEKERKELIENLKTKGITDINVLNAMRKIERHLFIPSALEHLAYRDIALPIGYEQTISQPFTVAFMTQCLGLNKGDKVLEIGTGSGYQASILFAMGLDVYSIEKVFELYQRTQKLFDTLGIRVHLKCGDGTIGWNEFAPYNGIIVTAGSPSIPESLKKQLSIGGKIVIPVGSKHSQILKVITKIDENNFDVKDIPEFVFVPLIGKEGWEGK